MSDIIAAIDRATGCQQCGKDLSGSVSDDFCKEECQRAWQATNVARTEQAELEGVIEIDMSGFSASMSVVAESARLLAERLRTTALTVSEIWVPNFEVGDTLRVEGMADVYSYDGERWQAIGTANNIRLGAEMPR